MKEELAKYGMTAYLAEKEKRYGYIISNKIRGDKILLEDKDTNVNLIF